MDMRMEALRALHGRALAQSRSPRRRDRAAAGHKRRSLTEGHDRELGSPSLVALLSLV